MNKDVLYIKSKLLRL